MKPDTTLTILSLTMIVLLAVHMSQDIVYGYDPSGPANLSGVLILAVWLHAVLALSGRRAGFMILILGSFIAAMMLVIHLSTAGVRAEVVQSDGGLFFLWTLLALGAGGSVSLVLSAQGLWRREGNVGSFLLWSLVTVGVGAVLFGSLIYFRR